MFNSQEQKILHLLVKAEYMTATELSEKLGIGVKTVRTRIKELNSQLTQYDVAISSKRTNPGNIKGTYSLFTCIFVESEGLCEVRKFM
ncbi:HTH domain [Dorea longicatena]|nr:HTH domain [Dorea longicatena]